MHILCPFVLWLIGGWKQGVSVLALRHLGLKLFMPMAAGPCICDAAESAGVLLTLQNRSLLPQSFSFGRKLPPGEAWLSLLLHGVVTRGSA
jgi:hypothetical protein